MRIDPRLVIIGEAPGPRDSGVLPLFGTRPMHSGWRLREMAGLSRAEWCRVRRVNLFAVLPAKWSATDARTTAQAWCHALLRGHRVVLLGRRVAAAFQMLDAPPCEWRACTWLTPAARHAGTVTCATVPHPSGRNQFYNIAANRERVGAFLREAITGA